MKMTEDQYREHTNDYDGYCRICKEVTAFGGTEPDARKYPCETCNTKAVYGVEEALMRGWIEIVEESELPPRKKAAWETTTP